MLRRLKFYLSALLVLGLPALGQVPIWDQGKLEIMVGPNIHQGDPNTGSFQLKDGYPRLTRGRLMPMALPLWDGGQVYALGKTEEGLLKVEFADRIFTREGGTAWYWREPVAVPPGVQVVAAHHERLLLFQPGQAKTGTQGKPTLPKVSVFDLTEGHEISSLELKPKASERLSVVVREGIAYLFLASGELLRVPFATGIPELWKEDFWNEAGLRLFKAETPNQRNPGLFGKAFFDEDGTILLPAVPLIPLTKADMEEAFSKMSEEDRRFVIANGVWPPPTDREVSYKEWACFLRLDPDSGKIGPLPLEAVHDFIKEMNPKFTIRRFKDFDEKALYGVKQNKIVAFANLHATPKAAPKKENPGAGKTAPATQVDRRAGQPEHSPKPPVTPGPRE